MSLPTDGRHIPNNEFSEGRSMERIEMHKALQLRTENSVRSCNCYSIKVMMIAVTCQLVCHC